MRTAVYSGSFNPLHVGHLAIMRHLTEVAGFDRVLLVVSPKNPLKEGISADSGLQRYEAAREALGMHPGLRVSLSDVELRMEPPHYTIRTLDELRRQFPDDDIRLVVGADQLADFSRWKDYGRILLEYGVAVFPRRGYHRGHARARLLHENPAYRIQLLKAPLVNISSTAIREGLAAGRDMSEWLM